MKLLSSLALCLAATARLCAQAPAITSLSPASGAPGISVTINGSNFGSSPAANTVYFGAVRGTVTSASPGALTVTVPVGATYKPVTVATANLVASSPTPFAVAYAGGGSTLSASSFAAAQTFGGGGYATEGDLDGDGHIDIVYTSFSGNIITLARNTGSGGSLAFATSIYGGLQNPIAVKAADLTGDGLLDLVVVSNTGNGVYVLRNTSTVGSIAFAAAQAFGTGSSSRNVAVADFDGDGRLDLAVSNQGANTVSVLRNTSISNTVSFASKVDLVTAAEPEGVAAGDLDGDGKPEIAAAGYTSASQVSIFKNTSVPGTISFSTKQDLSTAAWPWDVAIVDLNGDSKKELLVSANSANQLSVFQNTTTAGTLTFAARQDFPLGASPRGLGIGEINGDGKPDVAAACYFSSSLVSVLRNTSTGTTISFANRVDYGTSTGAGNLVAADLNGDGLTDLLSANSQSNSLSYLKNQLPIVPVCPALLTPANGATGIAGGLPLELKWRTDPVATAYTLRITPQSGPALVFVATDTAYLFTPVSGMTYTWSVTPTNMVDASTICSAFSFVTCASVAAGVTVSSTSTDKCALDSILLTASPAGAGRQWFLDGTAVTGATGGTLWAKAPGSYTVRVLSGGCYSDPSNAIVITNLATPAKPALSAVGSSTFCQGGSVQLTSSLNSNNQWFNGATAVSGANGISYSATQTGSYYVRVSNTGTGCVNYSDTVAVAVLPTPSAPTVSAGGPLGFCAGGSLALNSSAAAGNRWSRDGVLIAGATGVQYTATQSGSYTVAVTENGCVSASSAAVVVTVNAIPVAPGITAASGSICNGDSSLLHASSVSGNQWFLDNTPISSATTADLYAKTAGTYTVRTTQNGCVSPSSAGQTIVVNALPAVPAIAVSGNLLSTASGMASYQWYLDNVAINGATAAQYTATQTGVYKVQVTNGAGCRNTSANLNHIVTAISEIAWSGVTVRFFPNPVTDFLQVRVSGTSSRNLSLRILDGAGRPVRQLPLTGGLNRVSLTGLAAGVYNAVITGPSGEAAVRILKGN
ncbi:MAG: C-terminal target protein [Flaviaesturariibacter sp.]|nr:C-terminal target protein [Flaviaesturariibacter sp.]